MRLRALIVVLLSAAASATLSAHHSFVMFDTGKQVTITGSVTSFEWTNPHSYIEVDVKGDDGTVKHWSVEMGSPSIIKGSGWKHNSLKPGDKVTVILNPLKTGLPGGLLLQANLADGSKLGNGPGREAK